jgi:homoserine kinase
VVGGFTIVASTKPLEFIRLDPPLMKIVIAVPDLELTTKRAREALPMQIPLGDAVSNLGRASAMVAALVQKDLKTFGHHMVDSIAEPSRLPLIPGFLQVRNVALKAGALGFSISGAGPSVFAITEKEAEAKRVSAEIEGAFKQVGVNCEMILTSPGEGAKVVK